MYGFEMLSHVVKLRQNFANATIAPWEGILKGSSCTFTVARLLFSVQEGESGLGPSEGDGD